MKEKVLVLAPPLASEGGIQRYTATLVRALKGELGDQSVRCVTVPETPHPDRRNGRLTTRAKLSFGWRALGEVTRWKPGLIICTHLALGPTAWLLASSDRQYWIVLHGIEAWARLPYSKRHALRRAHRVIVTSAFNREQVVRRHQIDSRYISSLPCAWDDILLSAQPATAGPFQQISDGQPLILTVARMTSSERYKGHDVALRALPLVLSKVPSLTYAIVGDGDDRPRLELLAKDLGVADKVLFTGEISDSELAAVYRRSNVFVLPARTVIDDYSPKGEGFGIVFLEAMAFGKPVVGPNFGAPTELIQHGENGLLVDPEDHRSLADALVQLLTNPDLAQQMGKSGNNWVTAHYSYSCFRARLRDILNA